MEASVFVLANNGLRKDRETSTVKLRLQSSKRNLTVIRQPSTVNRQLSSRIKVYVILPP